MKSLKLHVFVLLCCVFSGQLAQAVPVSLEANGLSLNADWEATGESPQEVVLLLHGTMAHKDMEIMQALQNSLQENDIRTLAISLSLGIDKREGMLSCKTIHRHKHNDAGAELNLWIEWLQQQGVGKIWLLGHSRGGNQVASFGLNHPDKIAGLILIAPPSLESESVAKSYRQRFSQPLEAVLAQAQQITESNAVLANVGFLHCDQATVTSQSFLSYYRYANLDTARMLKKIEMPVLVVSGSEDKVSADIGPAVAELKKQNIQLLTIDGADHFFRDLYADDIVDAIVDLLE